MTANLKILIFTLMLGLTLGICSTYLWHSWNYPSQPLYVEVANMRTDILPLVKIEHGNDFSQEKILLTQLKPGESRMITLNHAPGKGYSVEALLPNNDKVEACVGKMSTSWVNRVIITENGVFSKD